MWYRARKELCYTNTPYGPLIRQVTLNRIGKPDVNVGFQNPMAFLHYQCENSDHFAAIMRDAIQVHPPTPSTPWSIILYQDGVDPGDGLAKNKSRHSVVFYWSFAEFGLDVLAHEEVWAPQLL